MGLLTEVGRIGLKIMFHYRFDLKYTYDDFDPKTKSPIYFWEIMQRNTIP